MKRIGLIVNPIAGLGGRVGLKGSDGADIQQRALALGAFPHATDRTVDALKRLLPMKTDLDILTCPGSMGEIAVIQAGYTPHVLSDFYTEHTTAKDTQRAVSEMLKEDTSLLMFTGGDGTARDIYSAGGMKITSLGIPAGVKIHSAVYAIHPRAAGELAIAYLQGKSESILAEVVDLDEEAYRKGHILPRLYGYLKIPYMPRYIQGAKTPSAVTSSASLKGIAEDISERMRPGKILILGPGSSTYTVSKHLGVEKSLLGVDVYLDGKIIASDTNETTLLNILSRNQPVEIIVTPIGGQGCIFGRGNQQISPEVIRRVEKNHIIIVSTPEKLAALKNQPLWVDTGDYEIDQMLCGYSMVVVGYKDYVMYKVVT